MNRALDLRQSGGYLDAFPRHVLQFMTALETLQLSRTNVSCFPPREEFSRLSHLRELNLSGTRIRYLPPSVLFEHPQLVVHLADDTPVSRTLDWSEHGLDGAGFDWHRMATTLPHLTSLNISGNGLKNASALALPALRHLRRLDVSRNPDLTPQTAGSFSWWKVLSEHETLSHNASFIGLANVGLSEEHVKIHGEVTTEGKLTCDQLRWVHRTMKTRGVVDLSRNDGFEYFAGWSSERRDDLPCNCSSGLNCLFVDEALFFLLLEILPSVKNLALYGGLFQPSVAHLTRAAGRETISLRRLAEQCGTRAPNLVNAVISSQHFNESFPSAELGEMKRLGFLDVGQNNLSGVLNSSFFLPLVHLKKLDLSFNQIQGTIPAEIGGLRFLETLSAGANQLSGRLDFLTELQHLRVVDLRNNYFSGVLPSAGLARLSKLEFFQLQNNNLTGSIPEELGNIVSLNVLDLGLNNMSGTIPPSFSALVNLRFLSLAGNALKGIIPDVITKLTRLRALYLDKNKWSGPLPIGLGALRNLQSLDLSFGNLNGTIPASIFDLKRLDALRLGGNKLQGHIGNERISRLTALQTLVLGPNRLNGTIPAEGLSALAQLEVLILENNSLSMPPAGINGMTTLVHLRELRLSFNKLNGSLPGSIMKLGALDTLALDGNAFSGTIDPGLCASLTRLTVLNLCCNAFEGPIPSSIGDLSSLQKLNLGANRLAGGISEARFGRLTTLELLALNSNQLNGTIPAAIGNLTRLSFLDLHGNRLSGAVPESLSALTKLEHLDLSGNAGLEASTFPRRVGGLCFVNASVKYEPCPTQR